MILCLTKKVNFLWSGAKFSARLFKNAFEFIFDFRIFRRMGHLLAKTFTFKSKDVSLSVSNANVH